MGRMKKLERLEEFGLNPDEWKQTYSVNQGQLYFFIWDESIYLLAGFYRAGWGFTIEKDANYLGGVAFVRV